MNENQRKNLIEKLEKIHPKQLIDLALELIIALMEDDKIHCDEEQYFYWETTGEDIFEGF